MGAVSQRESSSPHFMMGILVGVGATGMLAIMLWMTELKPKYMSAIDDIGAMALENAKDLKACTGAYLASHGNQLPTGTKSKGDGAGLVVVGYQSQ